MAELAGDGGRGTRQLPAVKALRWMTVNGPVLANILQIESFFFLFQSLHRPPASPPSPCSVLVSLALSGSEAAALTSKQEALPVCVRAGGGRPGGCEGGREEGGEGGSLTGVR